MAIRNITGTMQVRNDTAANWANKNPILKVGELGYDSTNKRLKVGDGLTPWANLYWCVTTAAPSFDEASWAEIDAIASDGKASKYFSVGDEKRITLTTGEKVDLVILGFDHDVLTSGGRAPISIGVKNMLANKVSYNSSNTNSTGWPNSAIRTSTLETIFTQLQADLQTVIKYAKKNVASADINDRLWLLSRVEIDGTTISDYSREGSQYKYYKTIKDGTTNDGRLKFDTTGNASAWWTRSKYYNNSSNFIAISAAGVPYDYSATTVCGVSFGFCI